MKQPNLHAGDIVLAYNMYNVPMLYELIEPRPSSFFEGCWWVKCLKNNNKQLVWNDRTLTHCSILRKVNLKVRNND